MAKLFLSSKKAKNLKIRRKKFIGPRLGPKEMKASCFHSRCTCESGYYKASAPGTGGGGNGKEKVLGRRAHPP